MLDFARNIVKVPTCLLHYITKYLHDPKRLLKVNAIQNVIVIVRVTKEANLLYSTLEILR